MCLVTVKLGAAWGAVTMAIAVGVAYCSDVDKVTEVLMSVAREHPLVMLDGKRVSPPKELFTGFGESSLNFELRCFIYAIEKELRRAGIEIPFPQRDIHVRRSAVDIGWQPDGTQGTDIP